MQSQRVVVVGAGVGGLSAALALAARGVEVLVLERAAHPGGKMRQVRIGDALLDAGPTVFTMRWVFDELFADAGTQLSDHLSLQPASTLARHAWCTPGGAPQQLDLFADLERSVDAIGAFAGAAQARGYRAFCLRAARTYQTLERPFLRGSRPNPVSLAQRVGWRGLPDLARISPFATLWNALGDHFTDPRLRQLFGRYATYCGASPFAAPATLMLVAHVEQDGVWRVHGGMHRVAQVLAQQAAQRGARFRYGAHVDELVVTGGRVCGVKLAGGETLAACAVVFNGDVAALAAGLLGRAAATSSGAAAPAARSLSALTWNLVAPADGFELLRHNVFFGDDCAAEFADLFARSRLPADPTVYVCAQDRGDAADPAAPRPQHPQRLLCLVNAPATGDVRAFNPEELALCEQRTFQRLARCGLQLQRRPEDTLMTTPSDFHQMFPATGGALYGQASHGWRASFSRPGSRSRLPGLYLAGGSTHPGPGVPMAALSGRLAASSLLADRASTPRWHPVAMPGGTPTR